MLKRWAHRYMESRRPDLIIGGEAEPYLFRWYIIPRNPVFNIYLHRIVRSDDDRALHDHPWLNCSILIDGHYLEHRIRNGGIHTRTMRQEGAIIFRGPRTAHRLEIVDQPAVTLFITGPRLRSWGFHCPEAGWVDWRDFTAGSKGELVGRGCGESDK